MTFAACVRCRLELFCALCPKKFSDNTWRPGPIGLRVIFHEDPGNTKSPALGPCLTAEDHLKDPLDPNIVYKCCEDAKKQNAGAGTGPLNTHDCDRYRIYPVRRKVARRYIEYMNSGADEVRSRSKNRPHAPLPSSLPCTMCHLIVGPNSGIRQNPRVGD